MGQVFHPDQDRIVSVRECARAQVGSADCPCLCTHQLMAAQAGAGRAPALTSSCSAPQVPQSLRSDACLHMQGFPDDFQFSGNVHNRHRQIGNAVPPPLAAALGRQLRRALEEKAARDADRLMAAQMAAL